MSSPATAIMGYAEMLMGDALQASCAQRIDDLQRVLDASRAPHSMVEGLLEAVRPVAAHEADPAAATPSRILVVDDNASNRDLLCRRLQRHGHTMLQTEDGASALALLQKEALDLVLLDLMMPG